MADLEHSASSIAYVTTGKCALEYHWVKPIKHTMTGDRRAGSDVVRGNILRTSVGYAASILTSESDTP